MALHPGLWVVELSNLGIVLGVVWNMTAEARARRIDRRRAFGYAVGAALAILFTRSAKEELASAPEAG